MKDKVLEINLSGCIYTGEKEVALYEFVDAFTEFCESKGWEFCGITVPLESE